MEDGKYRIKGRHEEVNPISESLQKRFIDNGMPQEVLTQLVGKSPLPLRVSQAPVRQRQDRQRPLRRPGAHSPSRLPNLKPARKEANLYESDPVDCLYRLITGCFVLLHISPMDFTEGVFRRITSKPKSIRSEVNESTRRKKKSFLRREIEETQTILRMTGRAAKFPMVCALSCFLFW